MGSEQQYQYRVTLSRNYIGIEREDEYFEIEQELINWKNL